MNIRPTSLLVKSVLGLFGLSIVQLFYEDLRFPVLVCSGILILLVIVDFIMTCRQVNCLVERTLPSTVPLGVSAKVKIGVRNNGNYILNLELMDHFPSVHAPEGLPVNLTLLPGQEAHFEYRITPLQRGLYKFLASELKIASVFKFWNRFCRCGGEDEVKVYPNYSEVMKYGILAAEQRLSQMGILKKRSRGQGTDFHQLREFRKGDRLNSIDWKATSKLQKIISKDYQIEQDQQIFFLLDCGRRMRAMDGKLSHFDHSINAMLLLTYVASRQGDAVGMMTFAGERRVLPAKKSTKNVNRFLNNLYDIHPTNDAADYVNAAEALKTVLRKRSLVVILSNTRDEDDQDLIKAVKLLRKSHLVVFASLKEEVLETGLEGEINTFSDALRYATLSTYMAGRENTLGKLKQNSIITLDTTPANLHIEMVNRYFEIKSSSSL